MSASTTPTAPAATAPHEAWSFSRDFQTNVEGALSNFNNTLATAKADNSISATEVTQVRQSFNSVVSVVSDATQGFYGTNAAQFTASTQQDVLQAENKLRDAQSKMVQGDFNTAGDLGTLLATAFSSGAQGQVASPPPSSTPIGTPAGTASTGTAAPLGSAAASQHIDQLYGQEQSATTVAGKSSALGEMIAAMQGSLTGAAPAAPAPAAPAPAPVNGTAAKLSNDGLRVMDELRQLVPSESSAAPSILDGLANISKALYNQALPPPATTAPGGNIGQVPAGASSPASPQEFGKSVLAALQNVLAQLTPLLPDNAKNKNVLDDVASFLMELKAYMAPPAGPTMMSGTGPSATPVA